MNSTVFKPLLIACVALTSVFSATARAAKPKVYFKLLEAYTQRTVEGREGGVGNTDYHFVIIWQGASYPETFFWRGENGFMPCNVEKVRKITKRTAATPKGVYYTQLYGMGDQLKKGDTLMLTPQKGGKFPIPAEIPQKAKNTLFYKTGGSAWLQFAVKAIAKKQDIMAP